MGGHIACWIKGFGFFYFHVISDFSRHSGNPWEKATVLDDNLCNSLATVISIAV